MEMVVRHAIVLMGVGVKMPVEMVMLVLVLQLPDGIAAALTERIGQAVEIPKF